VTCTAAFVKKKVETFYREFQKELYNFESLYKFIKRACAVF
jgi:hypothetical protein